MRVRHVSLWVVQKKEKYLCDSKKTFEYYDIEVEIDPSSSPSSFSLNNSNNNNYTTTVTLAFSLKNSNSNYNLNSSISEYSNLNNNSISLARSASCSCNSNDSKSNNNTTTAAPDPTTFSLQNSYSNYNLNNSIGEYSNLNNNIIPIIFSKDTSNSVPCQDVCPLAVIPLASKSRQPLFHVLRLEVNLDCDFKQKETSTSLADLLRISSRKNPFKIV
ncbi:hypothetical protein DICPUDRAFT_152396 [Dictyostelium purpureum]|uniref:Uncharacterized protein n=1 Tax=Dictyostelium purpureum TaxID=5786 RepID=F0ZL88_DICPU|nr:uncharacterized protein DICPUDRAFT_152396 [Dictyostelium purpureum]EGC35306.1 hypothetical protein DICPUDRAFT_152396 [Dictyostelium purpureum]|eukprot:XP_003288173.1 hypothetical protein DICPUDRAFT_152396 [Dictyostelium purpureum]